MMPKIQPESLSQPILDQAALEMEQNPVDGLEGNQEPIKRACLDYRNHPDDKGLLAILICVIDSTNSTGLTRKKRGNNTTRTSFGAMDVANFCLQNHFINVVESKDLKMAKGLIFGFKERFDIDLFSFFSKLLCYFDLFAFESDDFSIYDSIVGEHLYQYDLRPHPICKSKPGQWRASCSYAEYNRAIGEILSSQGISESSDPFRRRHFDNFIWGKYAGAAKKAKPNKSKKNGKKIRSKKVGNPRR